MKLVQVILALGFGVAACKSADHRALVKDDGAVNPDVQAFHDAVGTYVVDYRPNQKAFNYPFDPITQLRVSFDDKGTFSAVVYDDDRQVESLRFTLGSTDFDESLADYQGPSRELVVANRYRGFTAIMDDVVAKYGANVAYLKRLVRQNRIAWDTVREISGSSGDLSYHTNRSDTGDIKVVQIGSQHHDGTIFEIATFSKPVDDSPAVVLQSMDDLWSAPRAPAYARAYKMSSYRLALVQVDEHTAQLEVSYRATDKQILDPSEPRPTVAANDSAVYALESESPLPDLPAAAAAARQQAGNFVKGLALMQKELADFTAASADQSWHAAAAAASLVQKILRLAKATVPQEVVAKATFYGAGAIAVSAAEDAAGPDGGADSPDLSADPAKSDGERGSDGKGATNDSKGAR